ncbi:MAG: universal stress protein [Gemmatimonadota bacterium]
MVKSLLVGTNGTDSSRAAVDLAFAAARATGAPITCIGVIDVELTAAEPVPMGGVAAKQKRDARLLADERRRMEAVLLAVADRAREAGVECRTLLIEGSPAEDLCSEAERHDLVFIGRRAVPTSDHEPRPSATMATILRISPRPIVLAGGPARKGAGVLVAYDGSREAARALQSFVTCGLYADEPVHAVGVSDETAVMESRLQRAADYLRSHGRRVETHVLPERGGVADALASMAERLPASMVVLGVSGQPRLRERLFGSVTRSLVARVDAPTFLDS